MGFWKHSLAAAALAISLCGGTVWGAEMKGDAGAGGAEMKGATGTMGTEMKGAAAAAATATVNLNTADEKALQKLPGIGKTKAKAIIEYREKNGPFKTVADLKKVKGVGDKTVKKLSALVVVE